MRAPADVWSPEAMPQSSDLEGVESRPGVGPEPDAREESVLRPSPFEGALAADEDETSGEEAPVGWEDREREPGRAGPLVDLDDLRDGVAWRAEKVRRGAEELLVRVLPDALPEPPPKPKARGAGLSLSGRAFVIVVMAIPLAVFVLVVWARLQQDLLRRQQLDSIVADAGVMWESAIQPENQTLMRQGLMATLALVEDGLSVDPGHDALRSLKRRAEHKLDATDYVVRLYHFWQLATVEDDATSLTDSSRIVIHGIDVYLLNRGSDRVYKYLLNDAGDAFQPLDSDPVLVQKGEARGGAQLGDMVDIAWMEAGGERTLSTFVVLERTGSLLAYDPQQGIDSLPVADSDQWLNPQAIGGYYGNLYVLDPSLNRILKYVPTDNAYTNPPTDYLSPQLDVDLIGAVDMAIDGNLYVLFADGRILKFFNGQPEPFSMNGLPTPMRSPTTIFVSGPAEPDAVGYVYVTDTGNQRILQFDKEGNYLRQFKAQPDEPQMAQLRGIYVDEERGRMLILSERILWQADVPPPGVQPEARALGRFLAPWATAGTGQIPGRRLSWAR